MKFLCVPCDSPMKLQTVGPPDRGSLSIVYACPECGYEMAMLTNAYETQVVQSLGVRIGPADASARAGASLAEAPAKAGCPFARVATMRYRPAASGGSTIAAIAAPIASAPRSHCASGGIASVASAWSSATSSPTSAPSHART